VSNQWKRINLYGWVSTWSQTDLPIHFPNIMHISLAASTWRFAIASITIPGNDYVSYSIYRPDIDATEYTGTEVFILPIMVVGY